MMCRKPGAAPLGVIRAALDHLMSRVLGLRSPQRFRTQCGRRFGSKTRSHVRY
jgi:hypothetical protein